MSISARRETSRDGIRVLPFLGYSARAVVAMLCVRDDALDDELDDRERPRRDVARVLRDVLDVRESALRSRSRPRRLVRITSFSRTRSCGR